MSEYHYRIAIRVTGFKVFYYTKCVVGYWISLYFIGQYTCPIWVFQLSYCSTTASYLFVRAQLSRKHVKHFMHAHPYQLSSSLESWTVLL